MNIRLDSARNVGAVDGAAPQVEPPAAETPELMPGVSGLMFSGDPGAMLAALTMQTAHEEEKVSRAQRDACEKAQESAERAEIADLHAKADLMRAQAIVDGVCDFARAGMDFTSGAKTLEASSDRLEADDTSDAGKAHDLRDEANHADAAASNWKSSGEAVTGLGSVTHGAFGAEITDKDADSKAHDTAAQTFKRMADDARSDEKDAKALLTKALDFYKEYVDTKNQTVMAAIRRA
jgi:hypothetical protein